MGANKGLSDYRGCRRGPRYNFVDSGYISNTRKDSNAYCIRRSACSYNASISIPALRGRARCRYNKPVHYVKSSYLSLAGARDASFTHTATLLGTTRFVARSVDYANRSKSSGPAKSRGIVYSTFTKRTNRYGVTIKKISSYYRGPAGVSLTSCLGLVVTIPGLSNTIVKLASNGTLGNTCRMLERPTLRK